MATENKDLAQIQGACLALLRRPEVERRTGLKSTRIDELEAQGKFPKRVLISARAVGWVEHEVTAYIRSRIEARDQQQPAS